MNITYKEFENKLKNVAGNLVISIVDNVLFVSYYGTKIAKIWRNNMFELDIDFDKIMALPQNKVFMICNLCLELAFTPIQDREE
ncbi:MAG: hypothetical protein GYA87_02000, partial [Christensenellaceae bacterium]|nr:hypothetical protein [Christensenellaceae bacterium]